ncbi:protein-L-isoaspartate O-methyltransferase [Defluviimonas sp. WL0002]|uniref:Protein-L-isoaspartate O-methyltransferase n=1 Tax=Albidovulum marisflavi TaxID=2984159 RepID=A0ABT2Z941_9RHOB|nr:protein-L-isoaspartate O-methyltransferase [Defluviimonas sp. WL0002]MCV2867547.1 protein-L-isoaspartate O-methyltransferase [Defluviimonas sp. WL0002]
MALIAIVHPGPQMHISTRHPAAVRALEADAEALALELAEKLMAPPVGRRAMTAGIDQLDRLMAMARAALSVKQRRLGQAPYARGSAEAAEAQYCKELRKRLRLWKAVQDTLRQIEKRRSFPLLPAERRILDPRAAIESITDVAFTRAHRAVNRTPQAQASATHGCFADIPTRVSLFLEIAQLAYRLLLAQRHPGPARFLDVGCGGGIKVALAAQMFPVADGIEYDPGYAESARRTLPILRAAQSRVFEGDALRFEDYGSYDVIYLYRPMQDDDLLRQLEERILEQARPGAILLAPYATIEAHGSRFQKIAGCVYAVGLTRAQAEDLKRQTRRIGPHIVTPGTPLPKQIGWLAPLWRSCEANGFSPVHWE